MVNFILAHHWILALLGLPALLSALPAIIHKAEVAALKGLFSQGDAIDQKAIKAVASAIVTWAEEKYGAGNGPIKFDMVDAILAKALPFIPADDRKKLIEEVVKALDDGAHEAEGDGKPAA